MGKSEVSKVVTTSRDMGRSGSDKRRRYASLTIRLLPEERAKIEIEAERTGLSLGSYVRAQALRKSAIKTMRRAPIEATLLAQLLGQIGKAGGNLHQIVKRVNFNEAVPRTEIDAAIKELRAVATEIMQALNKGGGDASSD